MYNRQLTTSVESSERWLAIDDIDEWKETSLTSGASSCKQGNMYIDDLTYFLRYNDHKM